MPSTRSARKAVLPNRPKGTSTKPASVVSLNSIRVTKSWIARMKKASTTIAQAISRQAIWMKFSKKAIAAHQAGDRIEDRPAGIEADLRDAAGLQELAAVKPVPRRLQAEAGEGLEDDAGEVVLVADDEGEDADEERLLDQAREDVLVGAPAQNSAASVTSMTISVVAMNATSPPSRPKPLSM